MDTSWRITYSWSNLGCIKSVFGSKRLIRNRKEKGGKQNDRNRFAYINPWRIGSDHSSDKFITRKEENKMIEIGLLILILGGSAATIAAINS